MTKDLSIRSLQSRLISAAIRAPSGDNTQPWRFVLHAEDNRIDVYVDAARDPSPMNAGLSMARIACGAALENMVRAANANGWQARLDVPSDSALAIVRLDARINGKDDIADTKMEDIIARRVTNRRMYDRCTIPPLLLASLRAETPVVDGVSTHWVCGKERVSRFAPVIGEADAIMYGQKILREALLSNMRFDDAYDAQVEDGLCIASLEASSPEVLAMRTIFRGPDWLFKMAGAPGLLASRARKLVESASGLCLIVTADASGTAYTDFVVGRAMERAWLTLTAHGLAVQPMMSLLVLQNILHYAQGGMAPETCERVMRLLHTFRALVPEIASGRAAFLLRFGFASPPTGRTGRRPSAAVCTEAS